ncbi:18200_t:CDS:2, partial [Gigaspora margarita]
MSPFFATQQGASLQNSFSEVRFPQHRYQDSGFSNAGSSRRYNLNREVEITQSKEELDNTQELFLRKKEDGVGLGCGSQVIGKKNSPFSQENYKFSFAAGTKVPDLFCGRDRMDTEGIRKIDTIVTTFLAWLDMAGRSMEMLGCLAAIARMHKLKGFHNPTKN